MAIDLNGSTGISLDDNEKINLGNSDDLQIYHDGSNSYIDEVGSGTLYVRADSATTIANPSGTISARFRPSTHASLYYNGSVKLDTTSTGVDVTGTVTSDGLTVETTADNGTVIQAHDNSTTTYPLKVQNAAGSGRLEIGTYGINNNIDLKIQTADTNRINVDTNGDISFYEDTGSTAKFFWDASAESLGIGTTSPSEDLHVSGTGDKTIGVESTNTGTGANAGVKILSADGGDFLWQTGNVTGNALRLYDLNASAERMRIDSSGNLLVGTTTATLYNATSGTGLSYRNGVALDIARENTGAGQPLINLNLTGADGDHLLFYKDGTVVGSISYFSHGFQLQGESGHSGISFAGNSWIPLDGGTRTDDLISLGLSTYRFDDAYITNGVTTGSDENDKNSIAVLTDTEMLVAARLSQTFRTYKWNKAVALKGDNARTHTGTIAQEVQAAFTAEGLDAGDYAMFMSNTWWEHDVDVPAVEAVAEVTDEDGNVTTEAVEAVDAYTRTDNYDTEAEAPEGATSKTRMGIRYPELLSFVAAYNEQRFASIEARLTALEA